MARGRILDAELSPPCLTARSRAAIVTLISSSVNVTVVVVFFESAFMCYWCIIEDFAAEDRGYNHHQYVNLLMGCFELPRSTRRRTWPRLL